MNKMKFFFLGAAMLLSVAGVKAQYSGYNLALVSVVSPANDPHQLCMPNFLPVKVVLANLGTQDYNFFVDTIGIGYEITNPNGKVHDGYISIRSGILLFGTMDTIEIMPILPIITLPYAFKIWITNPIGDVFSCDDTINHVYNSQKINLPYDENFSSVNMPDELISVPHMSGGIWEGYRPTGSDIVQPNTNSGPGLIRCIGANTIATLTTRQINLQGTINPKMEFWYYHDIAAPVTDRLNISVVINGVPTIIGIIMKKGYNTQWEKYSFDLTPYTLEQCVYIQFEAVNGNNSTGQYIDRISFFSCGVITYYSATFYIGNSYSDANFTNLTQAGTYYDTLTNINGCDSIVCLTLTGLNAHISGIVQRQDSTLLSSGIVMLYAVQSGGQYSLSDSVSLASNGSYLFTDVADGDYVVKFIPDSSENALPTYYGNTEFWHLADTVTILNNLPADSINITIIPLDSLNGSSFISGYVGKGDGTKSISQKAVDKPAEDVNVYLQKQQSSTWKTVAQSLTNEDGYFEFRNVPAGRYRLILDVPGLEIDKPEVIDVGDGDTIQNIEYEITEEGIKNNSNVGVVETQLIASLRIYPNPTNGQLTINGEDKGACPLVEVYNVIGQIIFTSTLSALSPETIIDISHLANGLYFLKIDNKMFKIIKN